MKKVVRAVSLMLLMAGVCGNAFAEENENIVRQGAIRGRVIDNGKQILPGASIFIENLKTGVISDVNGFYTLPNLKPGTYTVKVTYVGYSPIEMKVTVPEGKTLEKDIVMNEGLELQEVAPVALGIFASGERNIWDLAAVAQQGPLPMSTLKSVSYTHLCFFFTARWFPSW